MLCDFMRARPGVRQSVVCLVRCVCRAVHCLWLSVTLRGLVGFENGAFHRLGAALGAGNGEGTRWLLVCLCCWLLGGFGVCRDG
jgi:hypothetical protein